MTLWTLQKDVHHVQAELHFIDMAHGYEIVFTCNGQVLERHLWPGEDAAEEVVALAEAKRVELERQGWRACDATRAMTPC